MPAKSTFGQFCPIALASEVLTQKWMLLIVRELLAGSTRFSDIRRGVPRISATLLKQRLQTLERGQIVERRAARMAGTHTYELTAAGRDLKPVLSNIGEWGQRWARDICADDLDPGWLVWNVHRRLRVEAMPGGRVNIEIFFSDATATQRYFWLVKNDDGVEVCVKPPGFEVDLTVRTSVRVLAEVWRGIRDLRQELAAGRIEVIGHSRLRRAFSGWLLLSVYAPIKRVRVSADASR